MSWFEGHLYCGTFRAHLCFKNAQKLGGPKFPVLAHSVPGATCSRPIDLRAQIWRCRSRHEAHWENVYRSPMVTGKNGSPVERECGYRGMAVVRGAERFKANAVCSAVHAPPVAFGPVMLRSEDGRAIRRLFRAGTRPLRRFVLPLSGPFNGRLYTSLVGSTNYVVNESRFPIVFESDDPGERQMARSEPSGLWRRRQQRDLQHR